MANDKEIIVAAPKGPFLVGHSALKLVDNAKIDAYDAAQRTRHVMISLLCPIEHSASQERYLVSYMPPLTTAYMDAGLAQYGISKIFESVKLRVAEAVSEGSAHDILVLLSPGLTFSRHQYNALAQVLASAGYAVATMDHTHETLIVEYSDGTHTVGTPLAHWDIKDQERHEELLATCVDGARFVLTQLGDLDVVRELIPGATSPFNSEHAAILSHSFGGATAVSALMKDPRFVGAINMDGSQYGPLSVTDKPVLLFGRGAPSQRNRSNNPAWEPVWQHLKGWKKEINLKECQHLTFCDIPLLAKKSGLEVTPIIQKMVGILDGERAFEI